MSLRAALVPITVLGALAAACATHPQPTEELVRARTVVNQADKTHAQRYAAADLQRAHDELNNAERSNSEGKYAEARRYAESAEADADVATARGAAGEAQRAAREVIESNEALRQESGRGAAGATEDVPPPPARAPVEPPEAAPPPDPQTTLPPSPQAGPN